MAYNIGQFRRSQLTSYSTSLEYSTGLETNATEIVKFYDPCLKLKGSNRISSLYSYYLKFTITQRTDSRQDFTIKVMNSELVEDNAQSIRELSVQQGTESTSFEVIFSPNAVYDEIVFELSRLSLDFYIDNGDNTSGRIMDITIDAFEQLRNVVDDLSSLYTDLTFLTKIGVQGPPGMLMAINGEEIRIGRSGIYELYNDNIDITSIGFVVKDSTLTQDGKDFFILDFKY